MERHYGLKMGDYVTCGMVSGIVEGFDSMDNNIAYISAGDKKVVSVVAEWCEVVSKSDAE